MGSYRWQCCRATRVADVALVVLLRASQSRQQAGRQKAEVSEMVGHSMLLQAGHVMTQSTMSCRPNQLLSLLLAFTFQPLTHSHNRKEEIFEEDI
jgi:hypothetical protein